MTKSITSKQLLIYMLVSELPDGTWHLEGTEGPNSMVFGSREEAEKVVKLFMINPEAARAYYSQTQTKSRRLLIPGKWLSLLETALLGKTLVEVFLCFLIVLVVIATWIRNS